MTRYKCIKELIIDTIDLSGNTTGDYCKISVGSIYEDDDYDLCIADKPAIHLTLVDDNISHWIELYPEMIEEYFEKINEGE